MNHRVRCVSERHSSDTVALLTELLAEAQRGELLGFVGVVLCPLRRYRYEFSGLSENSPTFTLGALTALQAYLSRDLLPSE